MDDVAKRLEALAAEVRDLNVRFGVLYRDCYAVKSQLRRAWAFRRPAAWVAAQAAATAALVWLFR